MEYHCVDVSTIHSTGLHADGDDMMNSTQLRMIGIGLVVAAVVAGLVVTGSVSTSTADRDLSVSVTDDSDAYLGVGDCVIQNQFRSTIVVDITHNSSTDTVRLAPGEQHTLETAGKTTLGVTSANGAVDTSLTRGFQCATSE